MDLTNKCMLVILLTLNYNEAENENENGSWRVIFGWHNFVTDFPRDSEAFKKYCCSIELLMNKINQLICIIVSRNKYATFF